MEIMKHTDAKVLDLIPKIILCLEDTQLTAPAKQKHLRDEKVFTWDQNKVAFSKVGQLLFRGPVAHESSIVA